MLAGRTQVRQALERVGVGSRAVVQHAPLIDDQTAVARCDVGKPGAEGRLGHGVPWSSEVLEAAWARLHPTREPVKHGKRWPSLTPTAAPALGEKRPSVVLPPHAAALERPGVW